MDQVRHDLLARPRFPREERSGLRGRHLGRLCQHVTPGLRRPDDPAMLPHAPTMILPDSLLDRTEQLVDVHGLGQKVQRPGLDGPHRHRNVAVTGQEDDRDLHVSPDELLLQIESAEAGQLHVEDQTARRIESRAG